MMMTGRGSELLVLRWYFFWEVMAGAAAGLGAEEGKGPEVRCGVT
jgi:hypothetical protein